MQTMAKALHLKGADYTAYMQNRNDDRRRFQKMCWDMHPAGSWGIIFGPNGRIIGRVRQDPGEVEDAPESESQPEEQVAAVDVEARADSVRRQKNSGLVSRAPSPRACHCKSWPWDERTTDERGKPTAHHPKCAWAKAWIRQKGQGIKQVPAGPTLVPTIHRAGVQRNSATQQPRHLGHHGKSAERVTAKKALTIPSPDKCPKCASFTKSKRMDPELHHPTCEFFKKHKLIHDAQVKAGVTPDVQAPDPKLVKVMLIDLKSQQFLREAEPDEVAEARRRLRDDGAPLASVDDVDYLVALENGDSLEPAEGEPEEPQAPIETSDTERPAPEIVEAAP